MDVNQKIRPFLNHKSGINAKEILYNTWETQNSSMLWTQLDEPCLNHCKIANIQTPNSGGKSTWENAGLSPVSAGGEKKKSLQEC